MSRYHSYQNSAVRLLSGYGADEPFPVYLKKYFSAHKKYGSGDRKQIAHLCYCTFRAWALFPGEPLEDKILKGLQLCSTGADPLLELLRPEWTGVSAASLDNKLALLAPGKSVADLFPFSDELSAGIDKEALAASLLVQPDLFLRIRPGYREKVVDKLTAAGIPFHCPDSMTLALPNGTRIEDVLQTDKEVVVQDLSSQRVGDFLRTYQAFTKDKISVWDCCTASGGKSILLQDILGDTNLLVSDLRDSILVNLRKRFSRAGLQGYRVLQADLTDARFAVPGLFDLVLADVPCSGSGTWGRNPDQLFNFQKDQIDGYSDLQKKIVNKVTGAVKPGGCLLYITCSVFRKENEEMTGYIRDRYQWELIRSGLLTGYKEKADTLYAALFRKPL